MVGIRDFNLSAGSNTAIAGINIGEGMLRPDVNNALRQLHAYLKLFADGQVISVTEYGATGDGTTDDAAAIRDAIAAASGKAVYFPKPSVAYKIASSLGDIPSGTHLIGASKKTAKIIRAFTGGYMANLLDGVSLSHLWFDGNSASYTGGIVKIPVSEGNQNVADCRFINATGGIPIHFSGGDAATAPGSRSDWRNIEAYRVDGGVGTGLYAIVHDDYGVPGPGHPISFHHLETAGYGSFSFGSCNDFMVTNSVVFSMAWSDNSRGVHIANSRLSSPSDALTFKGTGSIIGCGISPLITLGAGCTCNMGLNDYNTSWVDSSANAQTLVFDQALFTYTPTWAGGGTGVTIGNGSVAGKWTRVGNRIFFEAKLVVGTTTVIPAGAITVTLPEAASASIAAQTVMGGNLNTGGSVYLLGARITTSGTTAALLSIVNALTNANPVAFGGGTAAVIEISGSFTR